MSTQKYLKKEEKNSLTEEQSKNTITTNKTSFG